MQRQRPAEPSDRLETRTSERTKRRTAAEQSVWDAISLVNATDERDLEAYGKALAAIRKRSGDIGDAVASIERSSPGDPMMRWSLYYVLADLQAPELAPIMVEGAVRDLPEITETTACETVEEAEILVAVMAVEGLERLAATAPDAAIESLMEVIDRQAHVAVRSAAAQAVFAIRPDAAKELARRLPEDQQFVLAARPTVVSQLTALPERTTPSRAASRAPKLADDADVPRAERAKE